MSKDVSLLMFLMICFFHHTDSPFTSSYPLNDKISFHSIVRVSSMTTGVQLSDSSWPHPSTPVYTDALGVALLCIPEENRSTLERLRSISYWTSGQRRAAVNAEPTDQRIVCLLVSLNVFHVIRFAAMSKNSDSATWFVWFAEPWWSKIFGELI